MVTGRDLVSLYSLIFGILIAPVYAQSPPAVPVVGVEAQSLAPLPVLPISEDDKSPLPKDSRYISQPEIPRPDVKPVLDIGKDQLAVLELFSTQACTFCPKADAMMEQLADRKQLIALSCHIDYFDVAQGSLSLPICSTRQVAYEASLNGGPKYTPQMVVNGRYDAIGYLLNRVEDAFARAREAPLTAVKITRGDMGLFTLNLPDLEMGDYKIWLLVFDKPRTIEVAEGANRGRDITYYNVVSNAGFLGNWDGAHKSLKFDAKMHEMAKGFAVLIHDAKTNHIIAAAKYLK